MAVADKVKSIIVEQLGVDEEEVTPDASFVDDLGADSLDTVELVMAFEEEFGIEIPDEDAEKITRVKEAVEYIESHAKTRSSRAASPRQAMACDRRIRGGLGRRVVVTGVGLVSPLGIGTEANWKALIAGRSGIGTDHPLRRDAVLRAHRRRGQGLRPAAVRRQERRQEDGRLHPVRASRRRSSRSTTPGCRSRRRSRRASACSSRRASAGSRTIEREHRALLEGGPRRISPFFIPAAIINLAAGQVSIRFGAKGPNSATCTACSASAHAIGDAFEIIRRGDADVMIAGGSEAAITPMGVGGFAAMRALSTRNDEPAAGEPAVRQGSRRLRRSARAPASCILEELERAKRRGAQIYAELVGYGMSADAYHITAPSEDGDGAHARHAARRSQSAGIAPEQVDYINAHGTSTPLGDSARDARDQALLRRSRAQAGDVVDQVDDRPPARRRRRARGRHHGARRPRIRSCRRRSTSTCPTRTATSTTCRNTGAAAADRVRAVELVRLRRHERGAAVQAI